MARGPGERHAARTPPDAGLAAAKSYYYQRCNHDHALPYASDALGGFPAAIKLAREKAAIPAGETVGLKLFDKKKTFLEQVLQRDDDDDESPELAVTLLSKAVEASGLRPIFKKIPGLSGLARQVVTGKETLFPMMEYQVDYH